MTQAELHTYQARKLKEAGQPIDPKILYADRKALNLSFIQNLFFSLYPEKHYLSTFERLLDLLDTLFESRPVVLKQADAARVLAGHWYQSQNWVGMQLYVDRFCGDLKTLKKRLPYFEDLGVNFLHLMPLTTRPDGPNDGGYAVNSYTEVDPDLGTNADLDALTKSMRKKNMALMLDFVVNHTSEEFDWAQKAKAGDLFYQQFYYTYPDRRMPDAFEQSLPEIFPTTSPGNFTYVPEMDRWVMTVFNSYQWDLNYANPEVFLAMLSELVKLVNLGVDVVRFDALAFLWKRLGTLSQNLPEAHTLISLFKMCLHTVAPGVIFLAEAIVAPKEILKYFGEGVLAGNECEMAYNATLMALLWNSIATTKTNLIQNNLRALPAKPRSGAWINYIRCHDDIGLGFDDEFIHEAGWDATMHRNFLRDYFSGAFPDSPASGGIFMYNPKTGDGRIVGSAASLVGLEKALENKDRKLHKQALDKIIMLHGIILSYGGIPMIYAGDELALLNDYSFKEEADKKDDNRWMNRPKHPWEVVESLSKKNSDAQKIFTQLKELIRIRKTESSFADNNRVELLQSPGNHLLCYVRKEEGSNRFILVLANFSAEKHIIESSWFENAGFYEDKRVLDIVQDKKHSLRKGWLTVKPYQILWLRRI